MLEMTTNMPDSNTSTTAVQTESQTMSPSTLSEDSHASGIRQASADREGPESSTKERSYSMVSADIEGLKLDLLILQKKVEENANLLSANIQKQEKLKVATVRKLNAAHRQSPTITPIPAIDLTPLRMRCKVISSLLAQRQITKLIKTANIQYGRRS